MGFLPSPGKVVRMAQDEGRVAGAVPRTTLTKHPASPASTAGAQGRGVVSVTAAPSLCSSGARWAAVWGLRCHQAEPAGTVILSAVHEAVSP